MSTNQYDILIAPIISEKSARIADRHRQISFLVATHATKPQIKKAVESEYKVEVVGVTTRLLKPKLKRFKGVLGRRSAKKRAIVSLAAGHDIDFNLTA